MTASFVLRDASVLDDSGSFADSMDVLVLDGYVAAVGGNVDAPADVAAYDFAGLWLMPGVFDCHDHVTISTTDEIEVLRTPLSQWTLETAANLRRTLEGGVTFVRDAAGADAGIREAVARGYVPGPRLQICVNILCETGGHGDSFLEGPGLEWGLTPDWPGRPPNVIDGIDGMRKVVRQLVRAGADWIKLCSTGGLVSPHDAPDQPQFTFDEIRTAVVEAAGKGRWVMSHAFGGEGLSNAIRAGVRSIEHGLLLTEQQAAEMARAHCFLIPTLAITRDVVLWAEQSVAGAGNHSLPDYAARKALAIKPLIGDAVRVAREAGVKLAIGTDYISRAQHGRNLEELPLMREAGMTVEETLLAATIGGAELCGVADRYGRIAPGYVFDAIILDGDPGDLSLFHEPGAVRGVFRGGIPVVRHPRLDPPLPTLAEPA